MSFEEPLRASFAHWPALHEALPPWSRVALALAVALAVWLLLTVGLRVAVSRARRLAGRTRNRLDDAVVEVLSGTSRPLLALAAALVGLSLLDVPAPWDARLAQLGFAALVVQAAAWANRGVRLVLRAWEARHARATGASPAAVAATTQQMSATTTLLAWFLRTVVWAVALLAILSNLGVNITAFVASLGVGGIAVALAVQNVLGDLFASLAIAVDKPFEVGDAIAVGAVSGTVEKVGLKTTRIRALGGEQIVMSNTDLLKQTIANYKRQDTRRIAFTFGVAHDTPPDALARVPDIVREAVAGQSGLALQRAHFKAIGTQAHEFEVVYVLDTADYDAYMDAQQAVNLRLLMGLQSAGIETAMPTQQVRVRPPHGAVGTAPSGSRGAAGVAA